MKYVIMAGGNYKDQFETPKPLLKVNEETLIERTIRLLKENNIKDIAISTDIDKYNYLGVEILRNKNNYIHDAHGNIKTSNNCWLTAYYPLETPACYLAGDVYWTEEAINKIINIEVKDTMFIVAPDVCDGRKNPSIKGREPLGYKVQNQKIFRKAINAIMKEIDEGKFTYDPIAWNLYRKLNGYEMDYHGFGNDIFKTRGDYLVIDDLTTDIDLQKNIPALERLIKFMKGELKMVKLEALEDFTLRRFNELKNIVRKDKEEAGKIFYGDIFETDVELTEYLTNTGKEPNPANRAVAKVIEVIPEEEKKAEQKPVKNTTTKKTTTKRKTTKK